jgi:hypothetical protein
VERSCMLVNNHRQMSQLYIVVSQQYTL